METKPSDNQNTKPEISRRKILLVGLATTPVILSLFSKSAYSGWDKTCSVATSMKAGTSLHQNLDWDQQDESKYNNKCQDDQQWDNP